MSLKLNLEKRLHHAWLTEVKSYILFCPGENTEKENEYKLDKNGNIGNNCLTLLSVKLNNDNDRR